MDKELWKLENVKVTKDEKELVEILADAGCKASNIKRVTKKKSGKELSNKKVKNYLIRKIHPKMDPGEQSDMLERFLETLENRGGHVCVQYD